jgi:hypothetical protein
MLNPCGPLQTVRQGDCTASNSREGRNQPSSTHPQLSLARTRYEGLPNGVSCYYRPPPREEMVDGTTVVAQVLIPPSSVISSVVHPTIPQKPPIFQSPWNLPRTSKGLTLVDVTEDVSSRSLDSTQVQPLARIRARVFRFMATDSVPKVCRRQNSLCRPPGIYRLSLSSP